MWFLSSHDSKWHHAPVGDSLTSACGTARFTDQNETSKRQQSPACYQCYLNALKKASSLAPQPSATPPDRAVVFERPTPEEVQRLRMERAAAKAQAPTAEVREQARRDRLAKEQAEAERIKANKERARAEHERITAENLAKRETSKKQQKKPAVTAPALPCTPKKTPAPASPMITERLKFINAVRFLVPFELRCRKTLATRGRGECIIHKNINNEFIVAQEQMIFCRDILLKYPPNSSYWAPALDRLCAVNMPYTVIGLKEFIARATSVLLEYKAAEIAEMVAVGQRLSRILTKTPQMNYAQARARLSADDLETISRAVNRQMWSNDYLTKKALDILAAGAAQKKPPLSVPQKPQQRKPRSANNSQKNNGKSTFIKREELPHVMEHYKRIMAQQAEEEAQEQENRKQRAFMETESGIVGNPTYRRW